MLGSAWNMLQDFATMLPAERKINFEVNEETLYTNLVDLIEILWCRAYII